MTLERRRGDPHPWDLVSEQFDSSVLRVAAPFVLEYLKTLKDQRDAAYKRGYQAGRSDTEYELRERADAKLWGILYGDD